MLLKTVLKILLTTCFAIPAILFKLFGIQTDQFLFTLIFGGGIVVAAVLLTWAADAAQIDISANFAIAILALIAILPEYAVDLYFAFKAGTNNIYAHFASANMTGSNRLLLGIGWTFVVIIFLLGKKRKGIYTHEIYLEKKFSYELAFLAMASIYSFIIPIFKNISLLDSFVLIFIFCLYFIVVSSGEHKRPKIVGMMKSLYQLTKLQRFFFVNSLFLIAAIIIYISAEPFAESLIELGTTLKIDKFLLVQWIAPIATEAPELIAAGIFAWKGHGDKAIGTLLSSKINQWTLLIGSLPIAFYFGGGGFALPMDARQNEEFFLTIAQTILGFAFLVDLKFSNKEALILLILFLAQFMFFDTNSRIILSLVYFLIAFILIINKRREAYQILRSPFKKENFKPKLF